MVFDQFLLPYETKYVLIKTVEDGWDLLHAELWHAAGQYRGNVGAGGQPDYKLNSGLQAWYHDWEYIPTWSRGRVSVLWSLGIVFVSPRRRRNFFPFASSDHLSVASAMHLARWSCKAILNSLAPLGAGVSAIAPLPDRLPGLIEGSSRPQSSFEYVCLVVNLSWPSPLGG